ncbi:MAG: hypothetical protein B6D63_03475 [Candidatus Latescibacteria bacterium 4484_7]|nr:MAG: hypothetical protein B6D63_03475 [Candidatus Latescibacteria bacterium 4484_7]
MARRVAAVDSLRGIENILLLSAGDYSGDPGIIDMYRSKFLAGLMVRMGYDAVGVGERELNYGIRTLEDERSTGLPLLCSNLYLNGKPAFSKAIVKTVGGIRVGVFSLLAYEPREKFGFEIEDPDSTARVVLKELRRKSDIVILLAHMTRERLKELIPSLSGVDLIIRGHELETDKIKGSCVDTVGGAFEDMGIPVYFAGDRGRFIGKIKLSWSSDSGLKIEKNELINLGPSFSSDSTTARKLTNFLRKEAVRYRELKLRKLVSRDEKTGKIRERYLGINVCARCHSDVYKSYIMTPHFRAFTALTSGHDENKAECLICHTTGYGQFSGYSRDMEEKKGINLRGVQCEECHGPGTMHARDGSYAESARKSCTRCHTSKWSPDFDFEKYWEKVKHK